MAILNVPIQVRVDNEQNWDNSTLILKDGEPALCKKEDGTQELKFGDGQKTYKELSPFGGNQVEENSGDLLVTLTSIENNQASATYEQIKATINNKHLVAVIYEEEVYMLNEIQSNGTVEFGLNKSWGQKYLGISSSDVWYKNSSSWQAVNISIDEVEGLEATNVQDALVELKEDGVQLNDSAINTTEAWSSKKIVDTLCPEFSVSGNPVVCHPVEGYPLSAVVTLEPKQAGSGDPSPDNVRPISGRDEVTVNVRGKNLLGGKCLSAKTITDNNGLSLTNNNGTTISSVDVDNFPIHVEQTQLGNPDNLTSYANGFFIIKTPEEIPDDAQLTISMKIRVTSALSQEADSFLPLVMGSLPLSKLPVNPTIQEAQTLTFTFKISEGKEYAPQNRLKQVEIRIAGMSFDILEAQLELGSTPTPYEPYQGDTYNISLPETVYGGTVDAVTGLGSKTWGYIASYNGEPLPGEWISDRDVYASGTTPTTGAQVAYKLATPEPFQATGNQPLPAVAGLNTVYTDGDSLAVSGRQDLLYTLQTMQTQTQNLNRFIAEGGTR